MAEEFYWPEPEKRTLLGKRVTRVDGPAKVTGAAKYTYDINLPGMLYAQILRCPHAHATIRKIDVSEAQNMPGVKAIRLMREEGFEVQWARDEIAVVAAVSDQIAKDAVRAIKVEYEVLPHFVTEELLDKAPAARDPEERVEGQPDEAMASAEVRSKGYYGAVPITHCCLESHGQVCKWEDEEHLTVWASTQAVSALPGQFAEQTEIPASNVRIICQHMGGGFGSKFSADRWGAECARLARETGAPVKLMLERDAELEIAGDRPSTYCEVEVGAKKTGEIIAWSSRSWGSGGVAGAGSPPIPYVFTLPDHRRVHTSVPTNIAQSRAWRAPNHPQACFVTMSALEDLAAALEMDPLDFFLNNIELTGPRAWIYEEEFKIGADLIDWKGNWHPRGQSGPGPVKRGLGLSLHTWGGGGHASNCEVVIQPDGSVDVKVASQDIGVGTRTVIGIVAAETFGLPLEAVQVHLGDSRLPASGNSGGSTTVGGVSASTRRAAQTARAQLFARVAPRLEAEPGELEAVSGRIQVKGNPARSLTWKQATGLLGVNPLVATGANPDQRPRPLTDSGVGGIQMADVSVDVETGVVKLNKLVAVQDCGLIVDMKTAESQVYGGMIMGIAFALMEEKVTDPVSGRMLNNYDFEAYKLATIADVGELVVHMMTGPRHDERGVIGLGEPPVISPGAAISNAVANAIGVRVPYLPLTPDRVLDALEKGGVA